MATGVEAVPEVSLTARLCSRRRVWTGLLALPAATVVVTFVLVPIVTLVITSVTESAPGTTLSGALANYTKFLATSYYDQVLWATVRIAIESSAVALVLGYPIAIMLTRHRGTASRIIMVCLLCPLFVSVAVRAYAWNVLFAPSGPLGFLHLTFTEAAVVVALVQYLLPFSVLSLTSTLSTIDPALGHAARTLGSTAPRIFRTVTLPLSTPGIVASVIVSFSMAMTAFAIPLLVGGGKAEVMVGLVYQQQTSVFDQGFAAAISILMLIVTLIAISLTTWLSRRVQVVR